MYVYYDSKKTRKSPTIMAMLYSLRFKEDVNYLSSTEIPKVKPENLINMLQNNDSLLILDFKDISKDVNDLITYFEKLKDKNIKLYIGKYPIGIETIISFLKYGVQCNLNLDKILFQISDKVKYIAQKEQNNR